MPLGIVSRVNPINELAEVYEDGRFVPVEILDKGGSTIVFQKGEGENWAYFPDFSVSQLVDGGYQTLDLENEKWDGNELEDLLFLPVSTRSSPTTVFPTEISSPAGTSSWWARARQRL